MRCAPPPPAGWIARRRSGIHGPLWPDEACPPLRSSPTASPSRSSASSGSTADRLEVTGRWYGLRGHRFVRPVLVVQAGDEQRRMLAVLEHKPWAADDGDEWIAAFPWEGEPRRAHGGRARRRAEPGGRPARPARPRRARARRRRPPRGRCTPAAARPSPRRTAPAPARRRRPAPRRARASAPRRWPRCAPSSPASRPPCAAWPPSSRRPTRASPPPARAADDHDAARARARRGDRRARRGAGQRRTSTTTRSSRSATPPSTSARPRSTRATRRSTSAPRPTSSARPRSPSATRRSPSAIARSRPIAPPCATSRRSSSAWRRPSRRAPSRLARAAAIQPAAGAVRATPGVDDVSRRDRHGLVWVQRVVALIVLVVWAIVVYKVLHGLV